MNTSQTANSREPKDVTRWTFARRLLLGLVIFVTLVAVFFTIENWRGKLAWNQVRREVEAKGEVLDWGAFVPPPVSDEQNFYQAPKMREWFVRDHFAISSAWPSNKARPFVAPERKSSDWVVAELKIVPPRTNGAGIQESPRLKWGEAGTADRMAELIREGIGPGLPGATGCLLIRKPLESSGKFHLELEAESAPSVEQLNSLVPNDPFPNGTRDPRPPRCIQLKQQTADTYEVLLRGTVYSAQDYLNWTDQVQPDFAVLRKALERPYARIDGDYQVPFAIAIPNFIMIRTVAQMAAQRAQCDLLLNEPEAALKELQLIDHLCRVLGSPPSGRPITLVAAMIHVAVSGLSASIIEQGIQLHVWREPQLETLQQQLEASDLMQPVVAALREERAATLRTFEITKRRDLVKLFSLEPSAKLFLRCMPSGWFYQNMAFGTPIEQQLIESVDFTNKLIRVRQISEAQSRVTADAGQWAYNFMARIAIPNFIKAVQTMARNQTMRNEMATACALERYRIEQGELPQTLEALPKNMMHHVPQDLIGGKPLQYRRLDSNSYVLYSVGWNGEDDGGVPGKMSDEGDWVLELR